MIIRYPILFITLFLLMISNVLSQNGPTDVPIYTYELVNVFPHDHTAFTQGLVYENGFLYEGTGGNGTSTIRKIDLKSGGILQYQPLPEQYFGEGIAVLDEKIYQLTWRQSTGFVWDRQSLIKLDEFYYGTEGWGLTHDGERLIMSDGTSTIRFLDPYTYEELDQFEVTDNKGPVSLINELEYINGEIYANVWPTDTIIVFSPESGKVTKKIDLSGLKKHQPGRGGDDVLNGIAWDPVNKRLFVTGKLWSYLYEIKMIKK